MQPCTKGHARVQFYNDVIRLRDVFLLLGFNTMRLPMRMGLELLPCAGPVLPSIVRSLASGIG